MLVCVLPNNNCTRDRGCSAHPAFPAPSCSLRGWQSNSNLGRNAPRDREAVFVDTRCLKIESADIACACATSPTRPSPGKSAKRVFALDDRATQYSRGGSDGKSKGRGVLDPPLSRRMASCGEAATCDNSRRRRPGALRTVRNRAPGRDDERFNSTSCRPPSPHPETPPSPC
jgi:hypothetical protein